jgi:hypothetical protein
LDRLTEILILCLAWAEGIIGSIVVVLSVMEYRDEPVRLACALTATGIALVVSGWVLSTRKPHSWTAQLLIVLPWLVVRVF